MATDLGSLRAYYSRLSDEVLLAVDRDELVEAEQTCLDEEIARRGLDNQPEPELATPPAADPGWTEGWVSVCEFGTPNDPDNAPNADEARAVLRDAGIPCEIQARPHDEENVPGVIFQVMVPSAQLLHATSVLDMHIFNAQLEETWKSHFEALSDAELHAMDLDDVIGGCLDRVARLKRAYENEMERRGFSKPRASGAS